MDRWKYFDVTHRDHLICNPTSSTKLDEMIQLLKLPDQAGVLDIAWRCTCSRVRHTQRRDPRAGAA
jgi:hypothetical protein